MSVTKELFPSWFVRSEKDLPEWTQTNYPKDFTIPSNKIASGDINFKKNNDSNAVNPLIRAGLTHVGNSSERPGLDAYSRSKRMKLVGESSWMNGSTDATQWSLPALVAEMQSHSYITLNFEYINGQSLYYHNTSAGRDFFVQLAIAAQQNNCIVTIWPRAYSEVPQDFEYFGSNPSPSIEDKLSQMTEYYKNPFLKQNNFNLYVNGTGITGQPFWYMVGHDPKRFYFQVYSYMIGVKRGVKEIATIWQNFETVDGNPLTNYKIKDKNQFINIKHQMPDSTLMASVLFSFLNEGFYHFDFVTSRCSENPADFFLDQDFANQPLWYKAENFSSSDLIFLCLYWISMPKFKSIFEANTEWLNPDFQINGVMVSGDNKYIPRVAFNKQPIIFVKYSTDNTKAMILAYNPYNLTNQNIRVVNGVIDVEITLHMTYPALFHVNI